MSVKSKLLIALSLILLTAFIATSMVNYKVTRDAVRAELLNSSLPLTGKNIYSEIHSAMMRPILVSSSMANDTFLKDWVLLGEKDPAELTRYLKGIREKYDFITTFFVSAETDNYYYQDGILKKVGPRDPHDVWFYSFLRSGKEYDLDVDTNEAENNKLTIFINFRVEDDHGNLLGVAGVGVNMDYAAALLEKARKQYKRNVYLVDQDGLVQVHSDKRRIERYYITKAGGIRDVADSILTPRDKAMSFEYDWEDHHVLLSARYIPELEWHLIVEQDEGEALITARHNLIRTLAVGLAASILIIFLCLVTVNHFQERLERMAKTDPLTGAANRNALEEGFALALYRGKRNDDPFSIIIIDLDGFKTVNDIYGHLEGDNILKVVTDTIARTIRPTDLLARWGGDEFIVLLDGDTKDAKALAERIRTAMLSTGTTLVSLSCGITEFRPGDDISSMTQRADEAMYKAKFKGGDCIVTD